jgi:Flp pilus assembly protein TadG
MTYRPRQAEGTPMREIASPRNRARRGQSLIEFSFLVPWFIFLFVGAFDYGFFSYSLIATQTAAREGALYCASFNSASACTDSSGSVQCLYALDQLRMLSNVPTTLVTCGTGTTVTASAPVAVSSATLTAGTSPDGTANSATAVTVVYLTPQLIPIPGLLPGQLTITRTVKVRFRG